MSAHDDSRPQSNQTLNKEEEDAKKRRIRALNTSLRKTLKGGRLTSTAGFYHLGGPLRERFFQAVSDFNDFNLDNDPFDEHDFGKVEIDGVTVFWKIDYYDIDLSGHSPDPSCPEVTQRVLTLMLAAEY